MIKKAPEKIIKVVKKVTKKKVIKVLVPKTKIKVKIIKAAKAIKTKSKKKLVKKGVTPKKIEKLFKLKKASHNPIISPSLYSWESEAAFNPAAIHSGGRVHLFYRALGQDGLSRIGYASSTDGINFDIRLPYPVFTAQNLQEAQKHWPYTSPARLAYNPSIYASGGGWGGCEDPRAVLIDGYVYMTFNIFNGWHSIRVAVTRIKEEDLINNKWNWQDFSYLSQLGDRQKNWVLFPEKINGKFAIFHNLDKGDPNRVHIAYVDNLDGRDTPSIKDAPDPQVLPNHLVSWHNRTRSAASPPIKTKDGWLLLYHAMEKGDGTRYKVGAMILDLNDPEKVLYRAQHPILEPDEWYENDYKPGIVYANGAVVLNDTLFVYYGGGDKHIAVASVSLSLLVDSIKKDKSVKLKNIKNIKNK